ncbi:hypothetical protein SAMN05216466_10656 [Paraburkholderia phenazinium]|uniref:Uncharacterized protein n=1 Tax=Paraburkholderia phenazinium TaxID=60549 RepID=A0A1G7Y6M8_9BURK|nr:hypothetical protein [Paraburkholderia phenazinium]SDG92017.1 hypothetical protein SAMN05216466_10656 [Paraburkholderia phenazinium]
MTTTPSMRARAKRTQTMIDDFRGAPHEFQMLKGVLCMAHQWPEADRTRFYRTIDIVMVAQRMDAINNEARDRAKAELEAMQRTA